MGKRPTAAQTAFGPTVILACKQYVPEAQRLIQDNRALRFLRPAMRLTAGACKWRFARRLLMNAAEKSSPGGRAGTACRLAALIDVHAYAVDLPSNIDRKRAGMRALYGRVPEYGTPVPDVFEIDDPGAALAGHFRRVPEGAQEASS